jgi:hypothetical protein
MDTTKASQVGISQQDARMNNMSRAVQKLIRKVDSMQTWAGEIGEKVGMTEEEIQMLWKEVESLYAEQKKMGESEDEEDNEAPAATRLVAPSAPVTHEPMDVDLAPAEPRMRSPTSGMQSMAPPPPFFEPPSFKVQPPTPQTSQETGVGHAPVLAPDARMLDVPAPALLPTGLQDAGPAPQPMQEEQLHLALVPAPPSTLPPPVPPPPPTLVEQRRSRTRSPGILQGELRRSQRQSRSPGGTSTAGAD